MNDVLAKLLAGEVTLSEVERTYDRLMDGVEKSDAPSVREALCLSNVEWTAFAHGVWFDELAKWRGGGWPSVCAVCSAPIAVEKFGWLPRENEDETHELIHIECPK
jgi:hypothetical protein